jgi:hypothetical protein
MEKKRREEKRREEKKDVRFEIQKALTLNICIVSGN